MLTHDVEPIIDTLKSVRKLFSNLVTASHLHYSAGCITEQLIGESDIRTFAQICQSVTDSDSEDIIKLIYLRRHYEIMDDLGDAYQVLSNLFHHRETPIDTREPVVQGVGHPEMSAEKLPSAARQSPIAFPALTTRPLSFSSPTRIVYVRFICSAVMATRNCRCSGCFRPDSRTQ